MYVTPTKKESDESVQTAMQEKASQCSSFQKQEDLQPEQRDILREKVYCGDCGSMMRSCKGIGRANKDGERNVFLYYDCGRFMDSGRATCSTHYIRHEEIMDALRNALDAQVRTAIDFETFVKEIQAMPKVVCYESSVRNQLSSIQSKRRNMEVRIEQLLVDLTDGLIDRQEYIYAKQHYSKECTQLLEEENKLFASSKCLESIVAKSHKWIQFLKEYQSFPEINRTVIDFLVKRINIFAGKRIELILNYEDPFRLVSEYFEHIPEVTENAQR